MTLYLLRRFASTVVLLFVMAAFVYVIFYALPSNPAVLVCGKGCGGGQLAAIDHKLGLDQPEYVQFWHFLEGIFVGRDYSSGPDVSHCAAPWLRSEPVNIATATSTEKPPAATPNARNSFCSEGSSRR